MISRRTFVGHCVNVSLISLFAGSGIAQANTSDKIVHTDAEWQALLTGEQYDVL